MPKRVDHKQMREDLVERSIELFARWGYATLSIRTIATELGVSTGTLYHYFPNKQALFLAVADAVVSSDAEGTEALLMLPVEARLPLVLTYVDMHQERFLHHWLVLADVLRMEDPDGHILGHLREASLRYAEGLSELLGFEGAQKGEHFLALVNGLLMHAQVSNPVSFAEQEPLFRTVLYGGPEAGPVGDR